MKDSKNNIGSGYADGTKSEDKKSASEAKAFAEEMPGKKARRGRGKASGDLKLSAELLAVNKVMQEKFILLRQSIFAPQDFTTMERVRSQRHTLAQILGVHDKLVRAIEKTPSTLPATVLFALIRHYNLSVNYFTVSEVALSEQFIVEQKLKEFEYFMNSRRTAGSASHPLNSHFSRGESQRKGGWLKGLPRKAKDQNDAYLLALWHEAKKRSFSPNSVEDMMTWAKDNNIRVSVNIVAAGSNDAKHAKNSPRRRGHSSASRRGGWMLGLPRIPRTEEQKEQVRIWRIAQDKGLRFNSVKEMMIWWVAEGHNQE